MKYHTVIYQMCTRILLYDIYRVLDNYLTYIGFFPNSFQSDFFLKIGPRESRDALRLGFKPGAIPRRSQPGAAVQHLSKPWRLFRVLIADAVTPVCVSVCFRCFWVALSISVSLLCVQTIDALICLCPDCLGGVHGICWICWYAQPTRWQFSGHICWCNVRPVVCWFWMVLTFYAKAIMKRQAVMFVLDDVDASDSSRFSTAAIDLSWSFPKVPTLPLFQEFRGAIELGEFASSAEAGPNSRNT